MTFFFFRCQINVKYVCYFIYFLAGSSDLPRKSFGKNCLATLRFQPSNRGLVMDLHQAVFVRYVGFAFKWSSSLSTLQLTVDYSLDGIHWNDYVEDERVKVKQFYVLVLHKRSHYEVSRRIYKSAKLTTMAEKT